jgi:hypothetical protein
MSRGPRLKVAHLQVRCSPQEYSSWKAGALAQGKNLAQLVREGLAVVLHTEVAKRMPRVLKAPPRSPWSPFSGGPAEEPGDNEVIKDLDTSNWGNTPCSPAESTEGDCHKIWQKPRIGER